MLGFAFGLKQKCIAEPRALDPGISRESWSPVYLDPEPRYLDLGAPAKYLWDPTFSMAVARLSSTSIPYTVEPVSVLGGHLRGVAQ